MYSADMTFGEIISRAQQRGCALLKEKIREKDSEGAKTYPEAALRDSSGNVICAPDGLKLPLRYDLAFQDPESRVQTINADSSAINFREPVFATWEHKIKIEIHSMSWDHMRFLLLPANRPYDWERVREWFLKWFDADEENEPDENGLCGIVHFISDPVETEDGTELIVDFGSASSDALAEFFDLLVDVGVESCRIGVPCDPAQFIVEE